MVIKKLDKEDKRNILLAVTVIVFMSYFLFSLLISLISPILAMGCDSGCTDIQTTVVSIIIILLVLTPIYVITGCALAIRFLLKGKYNMSFAISIGFPLVFLLLGVVMLSVIFFLF